MQPPNVTALFMKYDISRPPNVKRSPDVIITAIKVKAKRKVLTRSHP
jgi:hypothetical protein